MMRLIFILLFVATIRNAEAQTPYQPARYGPPAHYDVLQALQAEFYRRSSDGYYASWGTDISTQGNFPIDVQLYRCEWQSGGRVPIDEQTLVNLDGYRCIVEVYPNADLSYRVYGFFYYDGAGWRYYGPAGPPLVIQADRFENGAIPVGRTPKPGSVLYQGAPLGKHNLKNPYDAILDTYTSYTDQYFPEIVTKPEDGQ